MPNPVYSAMGGAPGPFGNFQAVMQQFNQFRANFKGDPKQTVMQMVNSGRISQADLNRAQEMARQIQNMMGSMGNG